MTKESQMSGDLTKRIDAALGRSDENAGYEAFVLLRKNWPTIRAALAAQSAAPVGGDPELEIVGDETSACIVPYAAPPPSTPQVREADIRWAVNVLLEQIAAKFETWDTSDIWRSEAASTVRGFKHALAKPGDT